MRVATFKIEYIQYVQNGIIKSKRLKDYFINAEKIYDNENS